MDVEFVMFDEPPSGKRLESQSDAPLIERADDITRIIERCLSTGARAVIMYASNLPETFCDLSSGEAGVVLQKLRNYGIRLAVVASPTIHFSTRFREAADEEKRRGSFGVFKDLQSAREWLAGRVPTW